MAKVDMTNLLLSLALNNEKMKKYVYDTITRFSPTAVNVARILSHMANTSIHITREDKELWNSSFERAKHYMDEKFQSMSTIELKKVTSLPTTNISSSTIYLVPSNEGHDVYEQYVYSDGNWVSLGSTSVNMEDYYTRDQIDAIVEEITSTAKHSHANKEILDLITAPFTVTDKETLQKLSGADISSLVNHITNDQIHMTENDRLALQELVTAGVRDIIDHVSNESIHLTPEEKQKYDGFLQTMTDKINELLENVVHVKLVNELPATNEAVDKTIYCVPVETNATTENVFDEWLFIGGAYERIGWGVSSDDNSSSTLPDISNLVTMDDLKEYFRKNMHEHANIDILNNTTAIFTAELLEKIMDTATELVSHAGNESIHLTRRQTELIETVESLDSTVETLVRNIVNNIYFGPDGEDTTLPNPMTNFTKILFVRDLPTVYGDVNKQAIYFVPKMEQLVDGDQFTKDSDITGVPKSINYNKYVWSDIFKCWEQVDELPIEFVDTLPVDKNTIKRGTMYFARNGLEVLEGGEAINGSMTSLGINRYYDKYIWSDITDSWEVLYESPALSDLDIDYILSRPK